MMAIIQNFKNNDGNNCLGHDKQVLQNLASLRDQKKCLKVNFQNNVIFPLKKGVIS